jgi:hypothetical protein
MKSWIESISLSGSTLRVSVAEPWPAHRDTLAVASAIRVFERFPALDGLVLAAGGDIVSLGRSEVEGLLAPEGWPALQDRGRRSQVLARAVQRYCGPDAGSGA